MSIVAETVEKVSTGFMGSPLCLASVLLSAIFATLVYLTYTSERAQSHEREMALINKCIMQVADQAPAVPQGRGNNLRFGGPR